MAEGHAPVGTIVRGLLYVASIGLALHLILPQIPGIEKSARLVAEASPALVGAAFLAEAASEVCYARLLQRAVSGSRSNLARPRPGLWFFLRMTIVGYGAAHVLPGGGAAASAVDYRVLRGRGFDVPSVARILAAVAVINYAGLGLIFAGSLLFLLVKRDLGAAGTLGAVVLLLSPLVVALGAHTATRDPGLLRRLLGRAIYGVIGSVRRGYTRRRAQDRADGLVDGLAREYRAGREQLANRPGQAVRLYLLALGYWAFDALCLVLVFQALGVAADPLFLIVAYGVATVAGSLPLTPGGIGVFEATMLATLALLGVGAGAAVAVLGYRLFNFWLPIPLAAILYPTLRPRTSGGRRR